MPLPTDEPTLIEQSEPAVSIGLFIGLLACAVFVIVISYFIGSYLERRFFKAKHIVTP